MHVLVCRNPGDLALEDQPLPIRGDGEVLVKPRRIGICGTDYHIYEGNQPFLSYPRVMGHELAVEVVEVPIGSKLKIGQICVVNPYLSCGHCVACRQGKPNCCTTISVLGVHRDGGMTGLLSLPEKNLIPAEGLGVDECAMVEFLAIGAHAIRRGATSSSDRALIIGAGPIGLGAALFASLSGARVTLLDRDQGRLDAARGLFAVDHAILADDGVADAVRAITAGDGFDIVFDATGNRESIERGFNFVAHGGRYVLVSVVKGDITFTDSDFHRRELSLFASRNAATEDFERVIDAIRAGHAPAAKWITHRTTLAGAAVDLPKWAAGRGSVIKAVIEADCRHTGEARRVPGAPVQTPM
ncbi:MAG: zinc-binding alcohol dehydrogenase family protein [Devosia sp.]